MTNQLMLTQVRLVYEYLNDEATRCKNGSAPLSLLSHQHVLETARNGLFMVIRDTLGEGYDDSEKNLPQPPPKEPEKLVGRPERSQSTSSKPDETEIFGYPVADWKRVLDENSVDCPGKLAAFLEGFEKYRRVVRNHGITNGQPGLDERLDLLESVLDDAKKEEIMDTIRRRENKVVSEMNHDLGGAPLRYPGEAMLKDDIVRSSMYDLSDVKFDVGPVDFAGYIKPIDPSDDNVPTWRARAVFTVGDCEVQFWFEFDENGSAIANSVKAFDRMVHDGILHTCFDYKPVPEETGACKGGENE